MVRVFFYFERRFTMNKENKKVLDNLSSTIAVGV